MTALVVVLAIVALVCVMLTLYYMTGRLRKIGPEKMLLLIWLIVWLVKGHPTIVFPASDWAISLYICGVLSLWPRQYGL